MSNTQSDTKRTWENWLSGQFRKAAVLALIAVCIAAFATGCRETAPAVESSIPTEKTQTEILDTDVKTVEQLKELLQYPGELEITINTDLTITENMEVSGVKKISGSGMLMAPLGKCEKYYLLDVQQGAELTVSGITLEGNATADAIAVRKGAKAYVEDVNILWPFQYGVCTYGEAVIRNTRIEHALSAGIVVYEKGNVILDGAQIVDSLAEAMYLENGSARITGGTKITDSGNQGVVNRGHLVIDDASITGSVQYAVVNYGTLEIAYKGDQENGVINLSDNLKGAIFNYNVGKAEVKDLLALNNKKSSVVNQGKMVLTKSEIGNCGTNAIYNNGTLEASELEIHDTSSNGVYNISPGKLNIIDCNLTDLGKRGIHNEGGKVEGSALSIKNCGTFGLANNKDEYGKKGTINVTGVTISGCRTNVYNQGAGVTTNVTNSVLHKSREVNVYISYGSLNLTNVRILGTSGDQQYGLYMAQNTKATIRGSSEITGCTSSGINNRGKLTIENCRIHDNHSHRSGGGIYTQGVVYFKGGEIYNNTAASGGGGISVVSDANDSSRIGKLYMTGGKIYNNTAETRGGGIIIGAGTTYGSTFLAPYASITGGTIDGNKAQTGTGISTTANIKVGGSVKFVDNSLEIKEGYVVEMSSLTAHDQKNPLIIAAYGEDGTVVLTASSQNAAKTLAEKITAEAPTMKYLPDGKNIVIATVVIEEIDMTGAEEVTVSTFEQLKAAVESTAGGHKKNIKLANSIEMTGAIKVPASATVQIIDDGTVRTLIRDDAIADTAFFEVPSSAVFGLNASGENTLVLDGNAASVNATKALVENKGVFIMESGVSIANASNLEGPGAVLNNGSAVIRGSIFDCSGKNGGAVDNKAGAVLKVDDGAVLSNNTAIAVGGAICNAGKLTVGKATFSENHTQGGNSGAIHGATNSTTEIDGATFEKNYATNGHGGAIYVTATELTVSNSTFTENYIDSTGEKNGGAIGMNTNTVAKITDCDFEGNYVTGGKGGALYTGNGVEAVITGGSFQENKSQNNSGVVYGADGAQVTITGGTLIAKNSAANGALAYINGYTLQVEGATIIENSSTGAGGVIYGNIKSGFGLTMSDCVIRDNSSKNNGGVLYLKGNSADKVISDCVFSGNTAAKQGQIAYVEGIGMTVNNCSVTSSDGVDIVMGSGAENSLRISGETKLGTVQLTESTVVLADALAQNSEITIVPANYTDGAVVVTEEKTGLLENAVSHIKIADNGSEKWTLDENGKLKDLNVVALIGNTNYRSLKDAIAAAKAEDTIVLQKDTAVASVTVPAKVTLDGNGCVITGTVVLAEGAMIQKTNVTGDVKLEGNGDLTTVVVSGTVTVASGKTVSVGGDFTADTIALNSGATIRLTSALNKNTAVKVTAAEQTEGTVIITGDSALIAAEYTKFNLVLNDGTLQLGSAGKIEKIPFKATIVGKQSYGTLEDAVINAVDGDVIQINNDYTANKEIAISGKSITIESGSAQIFRITRGADLTANAVFLINDGAGLTLKHITVDGNGSAAKGNVKPLVDNLGTFTLSADATLTNNHNTTNGGGLFNRGSGISHIYGTISDCIAASGGAMRVNAGTVNIYDSAKIQNNEASGSNGGGIHANGGTVNVYKAVFEGNEAANVSGAIHIGGATVNIDGTVFTNNTAAAQGGIAYINANKTVTVKNITATGNASPEGNAFYTANNTVLTLENCNISSVSGADIVLNTKDLNVSGLAKLGVVQLNGNKLVLTGALAENSDVTLIPKEYQDGAVVVEAQTATLLADAVQYIRVQQVSGEKWVINAEGKLENLLHTVSVEGNKYKTLSEAIAAAERGDTLTLLANISEGNVTIPAGLTLDGGNNTVTGNVVLKETAQVKNLAVMGNVTLEGSHDLTTVTVSGTVTVPEGAAVRVGGKFDANTVILKKDATISLASQLGTGTTVNVSATVQTKGTVLITAEDNSLLASEYSKFQVSLSNGKLQLGSSGAIEDVPFKAIVGTQEFASLAEAVTAAADGATIKLTNDCTVSAEIAISEKITITSNTTTACTITRGGTNAVFNVAAGGDLTLSAVVVDGKEISSATAAVVNNGKFALAADATITKVVNTENGAILNNKNASAVIGGTISYCKGKNGGAVDNKANAELVISDGANLIGNSATGSGGAICNAGTLTVGAATFSENYAAGNSGAIHGATGSKTTVTGATFAGNYSTGGHGGAIYVTGDTSSLRITGSIFNGNHVDASNKNGGAVGMNTNLGTKYDAVVENCVFTGNSSKGKGGALYLGSGVTPTFTSCTFNGNTAAGDGQVAYAYKCTVTMSGCTVNSSDTITDTDVKLDGSTMKN